MAFVVFFLLCGIGSLIAAWVVGRFLWSDEQRIAAVLIGILTGALGAFCLSVAWVWWDGPLL